MQAIPASCRMSDKSICAPHQMQQGTINDHLLVAARLCGIETIYPLGGAQAIAAMAYGTETVTKVDKIFGPGNTFVTEAKTLVASDPLGAAIDMPAGPSELITIRSWLDKEEIDPAYRRYFYYNDKSLEKIRKVKADYFDRQRWFGQVEEVTCRNEKHGSWPGCLTKSNRGTEQ